ncbi:unnamed protein product [Soboliphyme baturini]|uniref:SH2 domain-containing protein n=1 Tax=Soboliphyme baturini TaxID=241478 RepID=A0A183ICD9_9BILA|nr:unnamed protein product [Soboliphyme baturini]
MVFGCDHLVEHVHSPTELTYYHGQIAEEDMAGKLKNDGDYLLWTDQAGKLKISVFWNHTIHHLEVSTDPKTGTYLLPRGNETEPIETVSSLDECIKVFAMYSIPACGIILKKPIKLY